MGRPFFSARCSVLLFTVLIFRITSVAAQQPPPAPRAAYQPGIYLVFPFENVGGSPRLEWLSEGLEELTIQRLTGAGAQVYSHAGRLVELERNGLSHSSKLSHATMLHIAEDLDADFVVFGRFTAKGTALTVESRILKVSPARLLPALRRSEEHTSELQSPDHLVCRLLLEKKKIMPSCCARTETYRRLPRGFP